MRRDSDRLLDEDSFYVVYNDLQQTGLPHGTFAPSDRQFVVKMNYLLAR